MDRESRPWWDALVDRWVRVKSRQLDDTILIRRKLLHTAQVIAVWPLLSLERSALALILLAVCAAVVATQRRAPYASLGLLTLLPFASPLAIAGAWAVFTVGDGLAALVGRPLHGRRLPWNGEKTWIGTITFAVAASLALLILLRSVEGAGWGRAIAVALAVGGVAAMVEALVRWVDDNYSVIVVSGALLHLLFCVG